MIYYSHVITYIPNPSTSFLVSLVFPNQAPVPPPSPALSFRRLSALFRGVAGDTAPCPGSCAHHVIFSDS